MALEGPLCPAPRGFALEPAHDRRETDTREPVAHRVPQDGGRNGQNRHDRNAYQIPPGEGPGCEE